MTSNEMWFMFILTDISPDDDFDQRLTVPRFFYAASTKEEVLQTCGVIFPGMEFHETEVFQDDYGDNVYYTESRPYTDEGLGVLVFVVSAVDGMFAPIPQIGRAFFLASCVCEYKWHEAQGLIA